MAIFTSLYSALNTNVCMVYASHSLHVPVSILCLFLMVHRVSLQYVIVVFFGHSHLTVGQDEYNIVITEP